MGQDAWEELDYTKRGTPGLENYGWRVYEGKARYTPGQTPNAAGHLVFPYVTLPHPPYCSVIGGYVYRGTAVPAAQGRYFFGDNCDKQDPERLRGRRDAGAGRAVHGRRSGLVR